MLIIEDLTIDYRTDPIGTDEPKPSFSWRLRAQLASDRGLMQSAYRIIVASSEEQLAMNNGDIWDSGKRLSRQSQHVAYEGEPLRSRTRYHWKVKAWDQDGAESNWSGAAYWETAFMSASEWQAAWITAPFLQHGVPEPDRLAGVPVIWDSGDGLSSSRAGESAIRYFRLGFSVEEGKYTEAKLQIYATDALYVYVNGNDEGLYFPYLQSVTLDVSELLQPGRNVIACRSDGGVKGFIAALSLVDAQGNERIYKTDAPWKVYHKQEQGWQEREYDDSLWRTPARIGKFGEGEWSEYRRILYPVNRSYRPIPVFGTTLRARGEIAQARLYISALGLYECRLNGERCSPDLFAPGWTDYRIRIPYQTYDVTSQLRVGDNRVEATVGPGWYAGQTSVCGPYQYGDKLALRAQIHIDYKDGTRDVVCTDEHWVAWESPIRSSDMYMGEVYDARLEEPAEGAVPRQPAIRLIDHAGGAMAASEGPPIRPMRVLPPRSVKRTGDSEYLIDMGQNMVGWIRLRAAGERGRRIRIRYAERLNPDGSLYTTNLRSAKQQDCYICKGAAEEKYEPSFAYHGFQYVEITGYPGELTADRIEGIVIHSALEEIGELRTSHPLVNRLIENIRWSQRGNFFGVPLDCPQRDERLGWIGDAHAFARTATYNMDCAAFYKKWLTDIRDGQRADGAYPNVAPDVANIGAGFVFFGDGGLITPWIMYKVYGDERFIHANYRAMKRWVAYLLSDCDERLLRRTETFGDHLAFGAETPKAVINAAFFAYSVKLMKEMSAAIGESTDAAEYAALYERLVRTFREHYVSEDGRIAGHTQTAYVLGLMIGLLPEESIPRAVQYLVENIERQGWHITTGFMGVSYILAVLTDHGRADAAFRLLLQESFPSWLYPVTNGATTIWERWDGWNEEKGFQDPEMNSFNHYALGSVGEWLYRYLAGIDIPEGRYGFQQFRIRPRVGGGFASVNCRYRSMYGWIESSWKHEDGVFQLQAEIPANTTAEIVVPAPPGANVTLDGVIVAADRPSVGRLSSGEGWSVLLREADTLRIVAGSGRYLLKSYHPERVT
ncbi:family 78 glycoside hydrolase catalytic domain [Paenibacillaceae bacterium WGS1546]|uniref:family 78 glycoside hydrolase catalytic domain n=1 Tax=Cohnella sp. WGS1546 TaxID=3366810 RepID=UPI00372D6DB3